MGHGAVLALLAPAVSGRKPTPRLGLLRRTCHAGILLAGIRLPSCFIVTRGEEQVNSNDDEENPPTSLPEPTCSCSQKRESGVIRT